MELGEIDSNTEMGPVELATVPGVNLKNTGQTTLYTVPEGKQLLKVTALQVIPTAVDTVAVAPIARCGVASAYTEVVGATTLTGLDLTTEVFDMLLASVIPLTNSFAAGSVIKLDVTTGATATTLTATVKLFGVLVDA